MSRRNSIADLETKLLNIKRGLMQNKNETEIKTLPDDHFSFRNFLNLNCMLRWEKMKVNKLHIQV